MIMNLLELYPVHVEKQSQNSFQGVIGTDSR
jgi:hypothetical protein